MEESIYVILEYFMILRVTAEPDGKFSDRLASGFTDYVIVSITHLLTKDQKQRG
jgi:hypothetical protein